MRVVHAFIISCYVSVAASENGVFTSPEIAKTFDFTSEEGIYNWYIILDRALNHYYVV